MKFDKVLGARIGHDGSAIFDLGRAAGSTDVAIPASQLQSLLLMVLQCLAASQAQNQTPGRTQILPVEWWEIGKSVDGRQLVFSYRMSGGAKMSFAVPAENLEAMRETLASMAGQATDVPPATSRQ